ncbi:restriction endonuclease subunit S [Streptomyces scopuliridis]|uniref:restriction endonuclease subunit S n=1 Tax=Streptomyces scopuliridis TaxID=452529 RepID=UPI0036B668AD
MRGEGVLDGACGRAKQTHLGSLLVDIKTGWSPACESHPPAVDEWGVVRVSSVTSGRFKPNESKRLPAGLHPRPELEIRAGDVLLARANGARALVGTVCYVEATRPNLMLSDKILRLVPDETVADPEFLAVLLATKDVRRQIGNLLNGGTGQNNISQADVRALKIPQVPVHEQRRIVAAHAAFDRRMATLDAVLGKTRAAKDAVISQMMVDATGQLSPSEPRHPGADE